MVKRWDKEEGQKTTGAEGGPLLEWGEMFGGNALNDEMNLSRVADSHGKEKFNDENLFIMSWRRIPEVGAFGSQMRLPLLGDKRERGVNLRRGRVHIAKCAAQRS